MTVSTSVVKTLEERGWIEVIGYREVPGRPALFRTTPEFLDDLGLRSLDQLPLLEDAGEASPAFELRLAAVQAEDAPRPVFESQSSTFELSRPTTPSHSVS